MTMTNIENMTMHEGIDDMCQGMEFDTNNWLYVKGTKYLSSGETEPPYNTGWSLVEFTALNGGYRNDNIKRA